MFLIVTLIYNERFLTFIIIPSNNFPLHGSFSHNSRYIILYYTLVISDIPPSVESSMIYQILIPVGLCISFRCIAVSSPPPHYTIINASRELIIITRLICFNL